MESIHAFASIGERAIQGSLDSICNGVRREGVHQKSVQEFGCRPCELAQNQGSRAHGPDSMMEYVFFGHEVHSILKGRHEGQIGASVQKSHLPRIEDLFDQADRRSASLAPAAPFQIDILRQNADPSGELGVLRELFTGWARDLNQLKYAPELGLTLQKQVDCLKFLQKTLGVVHAVDPQGQDPGTWRHGALARGG